MQKKVVIIGAGITGLTCAWKLANESNDFEVTLIEREPIPGGLAKTIDWHGYHLDLGPHRFHTEIPEIREFVNSFCEERMMRVKRASRMYLNGRYIPYPIQPLQTLKALGISKTVAFMGSALKVLIDRNEHEAQSYEEYVQRYYGKALYQTIFQPFAQKVWGMDPSNISEETARVRLRGDNIWDALKDGLFSKEKTYVSEFLYPRGGIGEIARKFSQEIVANNVHLAIGQNVESIHSENGRMTKVCTSGMAGKVDFECDTLISTIPLPDLVYRLSSHVPTHIVESAESLHFRAIVLLYMLFDRDLGIRDTWLYYPENHVPFSRIYVPDNFTQAPNRQNRTCLCLEYPCQVGDSMWESDLNSLRDESVQVLKESRLIDHSPVDSLAVRIKEGYPLYHVGYEKTLGSILEWLNGFQNCITAGRQGLFRHNNIDQAMQMGLLAAEEVIRQPSNFENWYKNVKQFNDYRIVD